MLAEKAALLGRHEEETEDGERSTPANAGAETPRRSSTTDDARNPPTIQPLTTPGDGPISDPLSQPPPLDSPSVEPTQPISEKARGKMRATESVSSLTSPRSMSAELADEELLRIADAGVGPNGYVPTQEWVSSWQKG